MFKPVSVQVHRFGDSVALYVGRGETVYISAADARKLARALNRAARSVKSESFTASTCGTFSAQFPDNRNREFK